MTRHLGLDLGGTFIKTAVLEIADGETAIVSTGSTRTDAEGGPLVVIERLIEAGKGAIAEHGPVATVGLGVPGLFDRESGTIELFPNLPGPWQGQPIRRPLEEALGLPVALINDARAFSLAEATLGAGRGCETVVCLPLGAGVGGGGGDAGQFGELGGEGVGEGVVIDGKVRLGAWGKAGEIGHQIVQADGAECGCGNRGCVEALTKADVLTSLAGKETVEEVYRTAAAGDSRSVAAIETVADWLAIGLANTIATLGPDRIVIGGGIVAAGDAALEPIRRHVRSRVTLVPADEIQIVAAELGPMAGAVGAALAPLSAQAVRAR